MNIIVTKSQNILFLRITESNTCREKTCRTPQNILSIFVLTIDNENVVLDNRCSETKWRSLITRKLISAHYAVDTFAFFSLFFYGLLHNVHLVGCNIFFLSRNKADLTVPIRLLCRTKSIFEFRRV